MNLMNLAVRCELVRDLHTSHRRPHPVVLLCCESAVAASGHRPPPREMNREDEGDGGKVIFTEES